MTELNLKGLKESLRLLFILFDEYLKHDNVSETFPVYEVLAITLHNMAFDKSDCAGYNHDAEVQKMYSGRKLFHSFAKFYSSHHTIQWINDEIDMAVSYADMSDV
jgi:hypothetical protein